MQMRQFCCFHQRVNFRACYTWVWSSSAQNQHLQVRNFHTEWRATSISVSCSPVRLIKLKCQIEKAEWLNKVETSAGVLLDCSGKRGIWPCRNISQLICYLKPLSHVFSFPLIWRHFERVCFMSWWAQCYFSVKISTAILLGWTQ